MRPGNTATISAVSTRMHASAIYITDAGTEHSGSTAPRARCLVPDGCVVAG